MTAVRLVIIQMDLILASVIADIQGMDEPVEVLVFDKKKKKEKKKEKKKGMKKRKEKRYKRKEKTKRNKTIINYQTSYIVYLYAHI